MDFKRILAAIISAAMLSTAVLAHTPLFPENHEANSESTDNSNPVEDEQTPQDADSAEDTENSQNSFVDPFYNPKDHYYKLFSSILDLYLDKHLYDATKEQILDEMIRLLLEDNPMYFKYYINTMLSTLDPYSSYYEASSKFLDPETAQKGFGFMIAENPDGKGSIIEKVLEGSAAKEAGLLAGDKFISVAGYNVKNLPLDVTMTILQHPYHFILGKNEKGGYDDYNPECEITIERNGVQMTVMLKKGEMIVEQISSRVIENEGGDVGYIQLSSFLGSDMPEKFESTVKEFADSGIKKLTIDLRDNGGGSLEYALAMSEVFLDEGELICYYNDKTLNEPHPIYSTTPKINFDSITVLVNENTASAAELTASILQSHSVAKVVGTKTVGKSIGQTVYMLTNGDYITITTYEILDLNKSSYNGIGIIPDLEIENVELFYSLPSLPIFNHQNYVEIKKGEYSESALALEKRLVIMGYLYEEDADGIFDDTTSNSLRVLQKLENIECKGDVTYDTVTKITGIINGFKTHTYYEDSQLDVALIVHRSFSQGKRLVSEKEKLAEDNKKLIEEREKAILEELDRIEAAEEAAKKAS